MNLLSVHELKKNYGGVQALKPTSFSTAAGEIVAVVGDNGAGKSTLMQCLSGAVMPDGGTIMFNGEDCTHTGPSETRHFGMAMIYQDLGLCRQQPVLANIFLGSEITKNGFLDKRSMMMRAKEILAELHIDLNLETPVEHLSGGQRQAVAIARAMINPPKLLIMDEPNAALGVRESENVLQLIRRLKQKGVAVLLITHRLTDVFAVADRVLIMRQGSIAQDIKVTATNLEQLTQMIRQA